VPGLTVVEPQGGKIDRIVAVPPSRRQYRKGWHGYIADAAGVPGARFPGERGLAPVGVGTPRDVFEARDRRIFRAEFRIDERGANPDAELGTSKPGRCLALADPNHPSNVASIVIRAFSSFDTGRPALALFAISWNFALSAPGMLTDTVK